MTTICGGITSRQAMRLLVSAAALVVSVVGVPRVAAAQSESGWTLVWSDEFTGTALDTSKWSAVTNCGDKRNNEQQCYMADDVSVANGLLTITSEARSQSGFRYTSGAVKTGTKFTQAYGRFEFSARLPAGGQGLWPTLWLYPPNQWPPEIDVLEAVNDMRTAYLTYHWGSDSNPQQDGSTATVTTPSTAFHVYAAEWEPGAIRWYIDGVLVKTYTGSAVTSIPMQVYINTALGGDFPGSVSASTVFPQTMDVDYVRVYTKGGGSGGGDTTAPTISVTAPTANATVNGTTTLTATASDNVGVSSVWFTVDGTTVGSEDTATPYRVSWDSTTVANGAHVIRALARDAAGNTTTSSAVSVTVSNTAADTTAPTVSVTAPTTGATVSGTTTVTAAASDNVGVTSVQFTLDGASVGSADTAAPYTLSWTTTGTSNGTHTVRAVARDAAGNVTTSSAVSVTVSNDTTAPTVSVTAPGANATVSGTVTLGASASDNVGVTSVQFTVDGANVGSADTIAPYSYAWPTTSSTNGARVIRAVARDAAGNVTTSSAVTVTVANTPADTSSPTVTMTAPATGTTVSGTVTVAASATDNTGITSVQFTLDGANLGSADTTAPYSLSWSTTGTANGSHTLRAVARDAAGNTSTSGSVVVMVNNVASDTTAPTVSLTAPSNGSTVSGTVTIRASASDNVSVASVQFTVDGAVIGTDTAAPYTFSWTTTGTSNGTHTVRAVARDAAGNSTTSTGRTVTVNNRVADTSAPAVSVTAPAANAIVAGAVTLTATASDDIGVAGVQFAVDGVNIGAEDTATPYRTTWTSTSVLNGSHVITATARDAAGNARTSTAIAVTVRNLGDNVLGDFNGDGTADLLFEHTNGQLYTWFMAGATMTGGTALTPDAVNPVWRVVSVDDFDGDGKSDLLWQNTTNGQVYLWFMDGTTLVDEASVLSDTTDWRIAATADFNGDGKPDILWKNPSTGALSIWYMNGATYISSGPVTPGSIDPAWRLAGTPDLNGDGRADLLWQNRTTGALAYWLMNGATAVASGALTPGSTNVLWEIRAVTDVDHDGHPDLIFQHATTGQLYVWYMNGPAFLRGAWLTPAQVDPNWQIVGGR